MNLNQYVSSTAAQPGLSVSTIINLKTIIIKSIDDQKSIVDYLDKKCTAIDTAIEQKQELIVKLTEYKKSLIYEYVTGKRIV
jgi:type I restriction enzyme S subunit